MIESGILIWVIAGMSLLLMLVLLITARAGRAEERLAELSTAGGGASLMPRDLGGITPHPQSRGGMRDAIQSEIRKQEKKQQLRDRIVQAGLYRRNAIALFIFVRLVLLVVPAMAGLFASSLGYISAQNGLIWGLVAGMAGTVAPSFWLDHVKRNRQTAIRRALPDALDVVNVCLEGGLSLSAAISRVAKELASAHPMLSVELSIVEREVQMGLSTGQAMRKFANRFDLEELRSLSSVITQAERFGTSVVRAIEVYSETLRVKRHQRAEELAHQAAVKLLIPTALFIFPGIFIVVLGPAAIQIYQTIIVGVFNG